MKSCLRHDVILAGDLHQPFALEHVVDLLLDFMLWRATCAIGWYIEIR